MILEIEFNIKDVIYMFENLAERDFDVIGIGEVMLRLSPDGKERISQSETFDKMAGGSELNVVSGIAQLGLRTGIITKLPDNGIGRFIENKIRYSGTSNDYIVFDKSENKRLGVYYYESGAYPRVSVVEYDRKNSSFINFKKSDIDKSVYNSTKLFHLSGITLALNPVLRAEVINMIKEFKASGTRVSFDVNYRAGLWDEETARSVIDSIMPYIDILFVSEETSRRMFAKKGDIRDIQKEFASEFPNLKIIASTKRTATSPTKHNFTSTVYDCENNISYSEEPYKDIEVVDRIGSGDAYVAGALFGILKYRDIEAAAAFGDAMSAVKNTIPGDMTVCDYKDICRVIDAHKDGAKSEMVR